MFGVTGLLISSDYNNVSLNFPAEAPYGIVIFSLNDITDSNWGGWPGYPFMELLIKARNSNYPYLGQSTASTNLPKVTINTTSEGTHLGTAYEYYSYSQMSPASGGKSFQGYSAGDHRHLTDVTISEFYPPHIKTKLYYRKYTSTPFYSLPIGALIFGENLNISGLTATSSYDNKYLCATYSNVAGTTDGTSTISVSFTTSNAGEHFHDGPVNNTTQTSFNGTGYGQRTGSYPSSDGQAHTHTGSMTLLQKKKYVKLRTYRVDGENVFISRGMIFSFFTVINHPDWFVCNGQTVRGYTTPNLVDRYIMCGNNDISSHNVTPSVSDDYNGITITNISINNNTWNHNHGYGNQFYQNDGTSLPDYRYHTFANVPHSHSGLHTTDTNPISYDTSNFNLIFYIYLPSP